MCGLVGVISNKRVTRGQRKVFDVLLALDTLRGKDSTGVGFVKMDNGYCYVKNTVTGVEFVISDDLKDAYKENSNAWALLGHNRAATFGKVTAENAHPFIEGHIMLAHNGTLKNMVNVKQFRSFDVDSHFIAAHMATSDSEQDTLELLNGAYALSWWNGRDKSYNLARNHERPMYIYIPDDNALIYSSSEYILKAALSTVNIYNPELVELPVGEQWKITRDTDGLSIETRKFTPRVDTYSRGSVSRGNTDNSSGLPSKGDMIEFTIDVILPVSNFVHVLHGSTPRKQGVIIHALQNGRAEELRQAVEKNPNLSFEAPYEYASWSGQVRSLCLRADSIKEKKEREEPVPNQILGPRGEKLTLKEARKLSMGFCYSCGSTLTNKDYKNLHWPVNGGAVCPGCVNEWSET